MRFLVYGTGAVGGYLGGRLALDGQEVTFLARTAVAKAIKAQGLRLDEDGGTQAATSVQAATTLAAALAIASPEIILLTVKAYDTAEAAHALSQHDLGAAALVCLQNGIGSEEVLAGTLGEDRIIPAALTTAVLMTEPGLVTVERRRGLGLAVGHPMVERLAQVFEAAGVMTERYLKAKRLKWSKLMTNIISNANSAILGWPPDLVFRHPGLYRLEIEAMRETVRVMRKMGFSPQNLPGVPLALLAAVIFLPPRLTQSILQRAVTGGRGGKLPSFSYDVGRGRSEVQYLNGAVIEAGLRLGVRTPANGVLTEILMGLVDGSLQHDSFRGRPERLLSIAQARGVPGLKEYNLQDEA